MKKKRVAILIRVYNRIEDLECNLEIIRKTWYSFDFNVIVVSNGVNDGYELTTKITENSDKVIILESNIGHLNGNSQLLLEGCTNISFQSYDYVIILEADTWIYTDAIIYKYINKLENSDNVWASARWYDRYYSLATDFAIIKSSFLMNHIDIFNFGKFPECFVANYLFKGGYGYIWIKENQNVMTPSYIKSFPFAPFGRFYCFPKSQMVTHHIEHLPNGMITKKQHFNCICGIDFFNVDTKRKKFNRLLMKLSHMIDSFLLRRSWYSRREYMTEDCR